MSASPLDVEQRDRSILRAGYSAGVRRFEIASIAAYCVVMTALAVRLAPHAKAAPWLALLALLLGYVGADFVSGFVHWMADTWGTPEWPLVGKALIRPFREHHVDPKEITRHDLVETNGNNCAISVPVALAACFLPMERRAGFFPAAVVFALCIWVMGTNQFHKWAHLDAPPAFVAFLQRTGVVLPPGHHAIHHTAPFARHYCITVGWLNEPLYRLRFFQTLERAVTAATGLLPREDDIGKRAALAVALRPSPALELPRLPLSVGPPPVIEPD